MTFGNSSKQFCSRLARLFVVVALGVVVGSGEALAFPIGFTVPPTAPPVPIENQVFFPPSNRTVTDQVVPDTVNPEQPQAPNAGGTVGRKLAPPIEPVTAALNEAGTSTVRGVPGKDDLTAQFMNTHLANSLTTLAFADPGAFAGLSASWDKAIALSSDRSLKVPALNWSGTNSIYWDTFFSCVSKKQKEGKTQADAQDECLRKDIEIGKDHQSANPDNPNRLGSDGPNTLRFTTMAFLSNKESGRREGGDMPFEEEKGIKSDSLKESFRLTSEAFCGIYGDVIITLKSDAQTKVIDSQMQRITPWTCKQRDPQSDQKSFLDRDKLISLCKDPVSLDVHRYCRAMYYFDLIKWTMQAQCIALNNAAMPGARIHQPMLPRNEQKCKSGSLLTGESDCPGPWGVTREDWDRTQEDLSLPGYTFTRGTAEAFFWAYRREMVTGTLRNVFDTIVNVVRNPGDIFSVGQLACGDLGPTGRAEFTKVARNWKGRHPVWVKAAMRFANARALLWTRDLTMQAWGVIQGFTSTMGMKELSEQAKQLLTTAYNKDDEATVQKQLEWTAEFLKKLEVEADLARKSGTGVVGNAR